MARKGCFRRALTIAVALGALEAVSGAPLAARPIGIVSAFPGPVGIAGPGVGHMTPAVGLAARLAAPAVQDSSERFTCQRPNPGNECYGPQQIRAAYRFKSLLSEGKDGSGRTIVIVDAFQDPTISSDLSAFDSHFGLPAPPSFEVIAPFGLTPFEPSNANQVGWSSEIALDVEWAHAIAPGAKLILALATSNEDTDLNATLRYVVEHNLGDVISMSFGEAEKCMEPTLRKEEQAIFKTAVNQGTTLFAASGDEGATSFNCEGTAPLTHRVVQVPASNPNVTGVGGTTLIAKLISGRYVSESVWDEAENAGSGGGFSSLYAAPKYQRGVKGITSRRGVPDVAYSADPEHGNLFAWGSSGKPNEFWVVGGTSAGTPQWTALTAIADQVAGRRLGNINPALYAIAQGKHAAHAFHDITVGNNSAHGVTGYEATPGWDAASGWGSPKADRLVKELAAHPAESGDQSSAVIPSADQQPAGREHRFRPLASTGGG